eukprot:3402336-Amphidinium_carterae.1
MGNVRGKLGLESCPRQRTQTGLSAQTQSVREHFIHGYSGTEHVPALSSGNVLGTQAYAQDFGAVQSEQK